MPFDESLYKCFLKASLGTKKARLYPDLFQNLKTNQQAPGIKQEPL